MNRTIMIAASAVAAFTAASGTATARTAQGVAAHGVYTEEQAAEGAQIYRATCAVCHGERLDGTWEIPSLKGRLIANFGGASLGVLFDYISRAMPQMAPGSLSPRDNAKVLAYILKENGYRAGPRPLSSDLTALNRLSIGPAQSR